MSSQKHSGAFFEEKIEGYTYRFKHLNWTSHVNEETIEGLLKDLEGHLEMYDVTLYYLDHGVTYDNFSGKYEKHYITPW